MNQTDKAAAFTELHVKGQPVVLYNVCDADSARSVVKAGVPDLATLNSLGVARVSYGPGPYVKASQALTAIASDIYQAEART